ncbi:MAG: hypothetical protein APR55_09140 [Methanolinea sp. SDB]|nr:MAG: hypothetical protein APR55_09140 [Methanolinea sp. SDB]
MPHLSENGEVTGNDLALCSEKSDYFPMRGTSQSGHFMLLHGTPSVFSISFPHFGHTQVVGGFPLLCLPIPLPVPSGIFMYLMS